ncbi:hypothetical protein RSAG8_01933, partial [Rhizoctonia solani AG-8 WAC10335]
MVAASSLRGRGAWSPRPGGAFTARKRYALQLKTQASLISRQYGKRKVPSTYCTDTESEPRTPKRLCHKVSRFNDENPLGLDMWEESDLEPSHEDMTVEYARSSEPPTEEIRLSDLSDISPTSPDDDIFEASSASSYEEGDDYEVYAKPDIKRFIEELPSLLKRRYRKSILLQRTHWIDDEPLRVKFLNRQFKHRLQTGDFTDSQILEVFEQRPVYGTYGDLHIPTPQVVPAHEDSDPEELDLAEGFDVERPATPMPDSDSDSDSDSDGEPVYESSQISAQLSRREMESMGIYGDEEYEYESEDE